MTTRARGRIAKETAKAGAGLTMLQGASSIGLQAADVARAMPAKTKPVKKEE